MAFIFQKVKLPHISLKLFVKEAERGQQISSTILQLIKDQLTECEIKLNPDLEKIPSTKRKFI